MNCAHCEAWAKYHLDIAKHGNDFDGRQFYNRWLTYYRSKLGI